MLYIREPVPDWPRAAAKYPDGALVKAHAVQWLAEAYAVNPTFFTWLRYVNNGLQDVNPDDTDEVRERRARHWFDCFIDGTFLDGSTAGVPHWKATKAAMWWNEYTVVDQPADEKALFLAQERVAARVWREEYRWGPHSDKLGHIRLVIGSTPVGNDMPLETAKTAATYDCILSYHGYDKFLALKQRDPGSWRYHAGRWNWLDQQFVAAGYKCDWVIGECGPYENVNTGWRSDKVLGGDRTAYIEAMRTFLRECKTTDAYREGRLLGFAPFVTGSGNDEWKLYETMQPELDMLADMLSQEGWNPGVVVTPTPEPEPEPVPDYCLGIDVSRYQGEIDWGAVAAAGYRFAAIRATIGDYYTDPMFAANWYGAKAAGLLVTAYHVVKPGIDAYDQIAHFWNVMGARKPDMPIVLDVELTDGDPSGIGALVLSCMDAASVVYSDWPIVYTGAWFWNDPNAIIPPDPDEHNCPLWIANYTTAAQPVKISDWDTWTFWQYSSTGRITGISGDVDLNRFNGTYDDLLAWLDMVMYAPEPNPEPAIDPGLPREQYEREYWVVPAELHPQVRAKIYALAAERNITVGPSFDDAGIGALVRKKVVVWTAQGNVWKTQIATWFATHYPGTIVEFRDPYEVE